MRTNRFRHLLCLLLPAVWTGTLAAQEEPAHFVPFSEQQIASNGIEVRVAESGRVEVDINLPGEVQVNRDHMAHIVPRLNGVVRSVKKGTGDSVRAGEVMLVLDSPELADAKAAYLAGCERSTLYREAYERERKLYEKQISPEQDYLRARLDWAEARIEERTAYQKLLAWGLSQERIDRLTEADPGSLTAYDVRAPFDGTVIRKDVVLGEVLRFDAQIYVVADLRTVWVDLNVYQKDLPYVRAGQAVTITGAPDAQGVTASIDFVGPVLGEETRTALARVVLPNPDGVWRPGLFVTAHLESTAAEAHVVVPTSAVQTVGEGPVVFVRGEGGFELRPVVVGAQSAQGTEILSGLREGEPVAVSETFVIKAELAKSEAAAE